MKVETFLALRYFKGNRKGSRFLSFIKGMSIAGVAIGSAGLLIALSIVHGFKSTINDKILGFAPHITVTTFTEAPLYRPDTVLTFLNRYPEIRSKQRITQGQVMIQTRDGITGTELKGIELDGDQNELSQYISRGTFDLRNDSGELPGIVLGSQLAETIRADLGSVITVYTISGPISAMNSPEVRQFELTGIFQTGIDFFDEVFAVVHISETSSLFGLEPTEAHAIEIKLSDTGKLAPFIATLDKDLTFPYFKESIQSRYGNIFAWVELQENMIPFVISVMIIVAAFNLIGTVLMMVLERTRDIGILKTMGSRSSVIQRIFLFEGFLVAIIGLAIGIGISLLFAWLQIQYQIIPLSEENYYMRYAPVEPHLFDFILTTIVTLVLCGLASWLPARIASQVDPLKVISYGR